MWACGGCGSVGWIDRMDGWVILNTYFYITLTQTRKIALVEKMSASNGAKFEERLNESTVRVHSDASYVASIDQGTSSSRFMIFDKGGNVVASHQREHKQHYPSPGMVEHDPEEIWENCKVCIDTCMSSAGIKASHIAALGITNQRETTVVWNKHTGKPYHHAIVWNDGRTGAICDSLNNAPNKEYGTLFKEKTGLPISPYFSGTKLVYLLENVSGLRQAAESGDAIFGTIDTWLVWKLSNGNTHVTDVSNASRTLMMNLQSRKWDTTLTSILNVPITMLPEIRSSSERFGQVTTFGTLGGVASLTGVEIAGILGDQQAALFGQSCFNAGETKCTYGTGAFLMMNTGCGKQGIIPSKHGLLTTIAYQLGPNTEPYYALEGSVAYCGSVIQWLRDNMKLIKDAPDSEVIALTVKDNGGVYFVPAFSGLFAPYWRSDAKGVITGITAYNTHAHIVRAALESAAFQVNEIIDAMKADSKKTISILKVDGGMTSNNMVMQFQADLLNTSLLRPQMTETTALGSAYAAGLAVGYYSNIEELSTGYIANKSWKPIMETHKRDHLLRNWRIAVSRSVNLNEPEDTATDTDTDTVVTENSVIAANNMLIAQLTAVTNSSGNTKKCQRYDEYWSGVVHATALACMVSFTFAIFWANPRRSK